jgi:hypothetical protein
MAPSYEHDLPNEETALLPKARVLKPTPLPKVQLGILMISQLAEPISASCILPFIRRVSDLGLFPSCSDVVPHTDGSLWGMLTDD